MSECDNSSNFILFVTQNLEIYNIAALISISNYSNYTIIHFFTDEICIFNSTFSIKLKFDEFNSMILKFSIFKFIYIKNLM